MKIKYANYSILTVALFLIISPFINNPAFASSPSFNEPDIPVYLDFQYNVSESDRANLEQVVISESKIVSNNVTYYYGWQGALDSIQAQVYLGLISPNLMKPKILVHFTTQENSEFDGNTITFMKNQHIVFDEITIYNGNKLDIYKKTIALRHEIGHALGLQHNSYKNDLMNPFVNINETPFISPYDVKKLKELYEN